MSQEDAVRTLPPCFSKRKMADAKCHSSASVYVLLLTLIKQSGYHVYRMLRHLKFMHFSRRVCVCVSVCVCVCVCEWVSEWVSEWVREREPRRALQDVGTYFFWPHDFEVLSQNFEKLLLALSCLPVCPCVHMDNSPPTGRIFSEIGHSKIYRKSVEVISSWIKTW